MLLLSTIAGIKCPIPKVAMDTLTPARDPVEFESMLTVKCAAGYVISGTSDNSKTYPCLASGHFDVKQNVCVGEFPCVCVCACVRACVRARARVYVSLCICMSLYVYTCVY